MSTTQTITIVVLLLVAGLALFINQQDYVPGQSAVSDDGRDAFVEDMSLQIMDDSGQPLYRMTAGQMIHNAATGLLELDRPLVYITRPDGSEWHISAERGEAAADGKQVWLPGAVEIRRLADSRQGALQITSSDVLVKPDEKLAETSRDALVITDSYRVEAVGLKADFRNNRLELDSRVRGTINGPG